MFCKTNNKYFSFFTTRILGAVTADLHYISMPGLFPIISRAARYLPNLALNTISSLCLYYVLYVAYTMNEFLVSGKIEELSLLSPSTTMIQV